MYIVYCQNKPKSEHIVSEYIDTFFEVSSWERIGEVKDYQICWSDQKKKQTKTKKAADSVVSVLNYNFLPFLFWFLKSDTDS